jgi:hypothetical protein
VTKNLATAGLQTQEPGAEAQKSRLARTVRALNQDDFAGVDLEIDSGKGRKSPDQGDRGAQADDGHDQNAIGGSAIAVGAAAEGSNLERVSSPSAVRLILLVTVAALIAAACSSGEVDHARASDPAEFASESLDDTTPRQDDTTTATPDEEPASLLSPTDIPGEPINRFDLEVGDCFDLIEYLQDGRPTTITTRLPCDGPHGFEVFQKLLYPAEHPSIYPGEGPVRDYAVQSCYREFPAWVGQEYELSELEIDVIIPPRENFEDDVARYRGIHCSVTRPDGEPMIGTSFQSGW